MPGSLQKNDITTLYGLKQCGLIPNKRDAPAMHYLQDAWNALETLEASLPDGPDRWQVDGLCTAREGIRRAWLAVSNLERGLKRRR